MEDNIRKAIKKYSNTLECFGYIHPSEGYMMLTVSFIMDFIKKRLVNRDNITYITELLDYISKHSCTFIERFICVKEIDDERFTYTFPFHLKRSVNLCDKQN